MSLRLRLFVSALAVILLAVLALVVLGGSALRQAGLEQLEARLCLEARRVVSPKREGRGDELRLLDDVVRKLGLEDRHQLRLERHFDGDDAAAAGGEPAGLASLSLAWRTPKALAGNGTRADPLGRCEVAAHTDAEGDWRVARNRTKAGTAWLAVNLGPLQAEWRALLWRTLGLMLPVALALAAGSAALLAQLMMGPLNRLREAMRQQRPDRLDQRLPTGQEPRELRELVEAYNTMLARLETSFHQASRFSADAAHELRTPLTVLQGRLERAIGASHGRELQAELGAMLDAVNRLSSTVRQLLLLSRADAGHLEVAHEPVDLGPVLDELVQDAALLAEHRQLEADVQAPLPVNGDLVLLRQLFNNLLSNALAYGVPGGRLSLSARRDGEAAVVRFRNDCEPLSAEARARLFQRFYRVPSTTAARREGSGLGLSLAREIARAHGGDLRLLDSPPDQVVMEVRLPQRRDR
ncbi:sensor histidine kinase [Inhella crocodyli]|uniref:histidine kinase n=1 Tax=Inhella crocodyli TaxID=2499851 RepID=A0A3S2XRA5_9BURK|nr:ATP-binding protein [Inhella crocodyli]RVT85063.1 HAMP domain-containing protein [Inhella crocodyli]